MTRCQIRGTFGRHGRPKPTIFKVYFLKTTLTVSYAKFHGKSKKHNFNANRVPEKPLFKPFSHGSMIRKSEPVNITIGNQ